VTRATWARTGLLAVGVVLAEWLVGAPGGAGADGVRLAAGIALGVAVVLARVLPPAGLGAMFLLEAAVMVAGVTLTTDALAMGIVMYLCARHGGRATLWASGLLMPVAYVFTGAFLVNPGTEAARRIDQAGLTADPTAIVLLALTIASPLALPWLLGVTLRWRARAERGRVALMRAEVEAGTLEQQAQLARDVHDVVGHSLAVILAQADSVRYLDVATPPQVQGILDTIADSARGSLTEVRQVLAAEAAPRAASDLDDLIAAVPPGSGILRDRVVGRPRPLPPDTAAVAHRVLQEMLTNAMKHGNGGVIEVVRDWRDGLRLMVTNEVAGSTGPASDGMGLTSMRQRVTAAQGELELRRDAGRFAVDAWLPLHGGKPE
jgi:signal transduction histidine kinase